MSSTGPDSKGPGYRQPRFAGFSRGEERVVRVSRCRLDRDVDGTWDFAVANADAIEAHWQERRIQNPAMFNGTVHVLSKGMLTDDAFEGVLVPVGFKDLLYWKDHGYRDETAFDVFGSALIRSREGHVLLGRQTAGNLNSGLAYLPGGFIDHRDAGPDGTMDLERSILREVEEETGLRAHELTRGAGYILTIAGPLISLAAELQAALPAAELRASILAHIAKDTELELDEIFVVRNHADHRDLPMPSYARVLMEALFPRPGTRPSLAITS